MEANMFSEELYPPKRYKIFVINLDRSTERLERIRKNFSKLSMDFERMPAVDGRKLTESQILEHYSPELNRKKYFIPLSKSEIGCYLSHLKVCEKIVSENLDFSIVLEDDVMVRESFRIVPEVICSINLKRNYIKLIECGKTKKIKTSTPLSINIPIGVEIENWKKPNNSDSFYIKKSSSSIEAPILFNLVTWQKPPVGTAAYAITKEGAEDFIKNRSKFFRPIDVDLQYHWETNLEIKGLLPSCVELARDTSTIQGNKLKYHYPFARLIYKLKYALLSRKFSGR